jgi:threonine/homoserine/homoserine lactone efflux protein
MRLSALAQGFRFGFLLQLVIGPVCLYVFRTGAQQGALEGLAAVVGVAFVDAVFIALAALGVTRFAQNARTVRLMRHLGAVIIALFAVDIIAGALGRSLVPSLSFGTAMTGATNALLSAALLTASSPLTILFWAGIFGAKVATARYGNQELFLFALGCVLSTLVFLSVVVAVGAALGAQATGPIRNVSNIAIGFVLLYFAAKLFLGRESSGSHSSML